jgi:uncharacterized protein (DUF2147 family)
VDGKWLTGDGDGWIEVRRKGKGLSGVVAGSPNDDPDEDRFDEKNPDRALRKRLLKGVELFSDFEYEGDGRWSGGTIYDPNSGKTYSCTVTLEDENTLKVRGYIGISLFGRTDIWTRVQD